MRGAKANQSKLAPRAVSVTHCSKCGKEVRQNAGFLCHFVRWSGEFGSSRIYSNRCGAGGFHEGGAS